MDNNEKCLKCQYYDDQGCFCSLTGKDIAEYDPEDECGNFTEK